MRIVVTGSAGFIGQWLVRELRDHGHDVIEYDRAEAERWPIRVLLQLERPDVCYHLAAQVGRLFGEQDIVHTIRANAELTAIVAKACGDYGIRLAYVSTSEVYGVDGDWVDEGGPFALPHNLYGLSKRWGEEVAQLYAPDNLTIARLSMPYGPGAPPGVGRRALDTFLWQAHHLMPLTVHKGAERSWCWVGDTVRGLRLIIEQPYGGAYNVGRDDATVSMQTVAEMACDIADAPHALIFPVDPPSDQIVGKHLNTDRLRSLGWQPTINLAEGMQHVYDWVKRFDANGKLAA